jgi:hypothetical protein
MPKKKVNPRKCPASIADVNKAKRQASDEAVICALAIFLTVMRDKEGYGIQRLRRLWAHIGDLSDSISSGRISIKDLKDTIEQEAGIVLK